MENTEIPYKNLSTDYERLWELVMSGETVACFDKCTSAGIRHFAVTCYLNSDGYILFRTPGVETSLPTNCTCESFEKYCCDEAIAWIVPSAGVDCE